MNNFKSILFILGMLANIAESHAQRLYAVSGAGGATSYLYELDPSTGDTIRTIGATGYNGITGIAVHPKTGKIYGHVNGV